jgi:hypothetical protein
MQFTALLYHITPQLLAKSFYALCRDSAVGVDSMLWREYEEGLLQQLSTLHARSTVGPKGYDSAEIWEQVEQQGAKAVIPRTRTSVKGNADLGRGLYRYRHLMENAFARLKNYRALASRLNKLKRNYESVVAMACAFLWLPM